jgi:replicative DNA helicase
MREGAIKEFADRVDAEDVGLVHGFRGLHELYLAQLDYRKYTELDVVDPIGFENWLYESKPAVYELIGGEAGYSDLLGKLKNVEIPETDALIKLVEFRAKKRRRMDKAQSLMTAVSNTDDPNSKQKILELNQELVQLFEEIDYNPMESLRTPADFIAGLDKLMDMPSFLPTQFPELNRAMGYDPEKGGFLRSAITTIAALSGVGKSTLIKTIVKYWVDIGLNVCYVNYEEPEDLWNKILFAQITGINVFHQQIDDFAKAEFIKRMESWKDRLKVRHDPDSIFYEDLERWIRDVVGYSAWKPDVIVIDTIQSLFTKSNSARWSEFEQMMVHLEKLAKDLDCAIVITAQQNRNSLMDKRQVFNQADIGGGSAIIQKSTVVMFLSQPREANNGDNEWDTPKSVVEVQMPKNRITGTLFTDVPPRLIYDDPTKSFVPYSDKIGLEEARLAFTSLVIEDSDKELGYD